jgi:hypothetical protein
MTLPATSAATAYIISVNINAGDPANYGAVSIYAIDGSLNRRVLNGDSPNTFISMSALTVVAIQNSGATQVLYATALRIGR